MGGVLGDLDDDGRLDLFVPDFGTKKLFAGDVTTGFIDRAGLVGLTAPARTNAACKATPGSEACLVLSWSAALADFDLDGRDELLVVNGETSPGDWPPVLLFRRSSSSPSSPPFEEVSPDLPCMDARGLVATDLDADGDSDLVIGHKEGPLAVYENRGRPAATSWLHVTLRGRTSNRDGVGAIVTLRTSSGRTHLRAVGAGGVVHTATPPEAAFGLGADPPRVPARPLAVRPPDRAARPAGRHFPAHRRRPVVAAVRIRSLECRSSRSPT